MANISVMGVTKIGNIVPRVGPEPTFLAFRASVLPLHHIGSLMSPLYPFPPVYAALCLRGRCRLLDSSPWNWNRHLLLTITYIYTGLHIHKQGRFNNHIAHSFTGSLSWKPVSSVMATSVMGVMKIGKIVARARLKTMSLAFWASVCRLPDVNTVSTLTCLCSSLPQTSVQISLS